MYECWVWIDGEWVHGWDVGDTEQGIKFIPEDYMIDPYDLTPAYHVVYSKTKPSRNPEE